MTPGRGAPEGLKPCPFCGNNHLSVRRYTVEGQRIVAVKCFVEECGVSIHRSSDRDAIAAWNTRAALASTPESDTEVMREALLSWTGEPGDVAVREEGSDEDAWLELLRVEEAHPWFQVGGLAAELGLLKTETDPGHTVEEVLQSDYGRATKALKEAIERGDRDISMRAQTAACVISDIAATLGVTLTGPRIHRTPDAEPGETGTAAPERVTLVRESCGHYETLSGPIPPPETVITVRIPTPATGNDS